MLGRPLAVAAFGLLLLALPMTTMTVSADEPPSFLAPVYDELEPYCQELREKNPRKDHTDASPSTPPPRAWDEFRYHPACYQLRNDLQNDLYSADMVPSYQYCQKVDGKVTCVATNYAPCDLGLSLLGYLYLCLGMILPDE